MKKNGVILMLILLCIAFLVSCAKREITDNSDKGELVRAETLGDFHGSLSLALRRGKTDSSLMLSYGFEKYGFG